MERLSKDDIFIIGINLDLKTLLNLCKTSKHINSLLCRDNIWLYNIKKYFPTLNINIMNLYRNDRSWKQYYIKDLYKIIHRSKWIHALDILLTVASVDGRLDLIIAALDLGANVDTNNNICVRFASNNGHLEVVKLLIECGADIYTGIDISFVTASTNGHLEVVKLLIDYGADIHVDDNRAVRYALYTGKLDVVDYLVSLGAPDPIKG